MFALRANEKRREDMDISAYTSAAGAVDPSFAGCAATLAAIADGTLGAKLNVTAIRDEAGVLSKHVVDSLYAAKAIRDLGATSVLDVGSGGGFPALPIAAALPEVAVTALDATAKKCRHVEELAASAGLQNVCVVCARAEEAADLFGSFDLVISRAVAALPALLELTSPHAAAGGFVLAMKGNLADDEAKAAESAAAALCLEALAPVRYSLPEGGDRRAILIYRKVAPTPPDFPRKWNEILKKPL